MSNLTWSVRFTGLGPVIERRHIYTFFQRFGNIVRLFVKEDKSEATIYFDNGQSAENASAAIRQPNLHNFQLVDTSMGSNRTNSERNNRRFNNIRPSEDIAGDATYMYDILGNQIPTLSGDDGESYVAISHLQRSGFRLFGTKPNKLAYDTQIKEYLRMYLQIQMYKFACKYKCNINAEDKCRIISSVAARIDEEIPENSRMPIQDNDDREQINTPLRRPREMAVGLSNIKMNGNTIANDSTSSPVYGQKVNVQQVAFKEEHKPDGYMQQGPTHENNAKLMEPKLNISYQSINPAFSKKPMNTSQQSTGSEVTERKFNNDQNKFTASGKKQGDGRMSQQSMRNDETMSQVSSGSDLRKILKHNYISVPLNKRMKVTVSYINDMNPKIAFLHLPSNQEKLDAISRDVAEEAVSGPTLTANEELICAVCYNSVWKRAIVRSVEPLRVQLVDYGMSTKLRDDALLRGLSENLQNEPWLAIRACKNSDPSEVELTLRQNCTYMAESSKMYEDGTHVFRYYSVVPDNDMLKKQVPNRNSSMNLANVVTSTPKAKPTVKVAEPIMDDTLHHPSIVDKLTGGMQVFMEFHFDTYCHENSIIAFICILNTVGEDADIIEKITNIPLKNMKPYRDISRVKIGDLIAIKSDEEGYFRCMVYNINNGVYSVAKVDVGTVEDIMAEAILELDDEIKRLPYLSCICTYPDLDVLKEIDDFTFDVNAEKQLSRVGATYKIQGMTVNPWDPLSTHGLKATSTHKVNTQAIIRPTSSCVTMACATAAIPLKTGDVVRVIKIDIPSCTFYVQSREMYASYNKDVLPNIQGAANDFGTVKNPMQNQAVIVKIETVLYRAVIDSIIDNNRISVKLIDVGGFETVQLQDSFEMDSNFTNKKYGCAQFKLDGLEALQDEAIFYLNKCIQDKEKFTIAKINNNCGSATDGGGNNLLDKLNRFNMNNKPSGFWYKNLKHVHMPIGKITLLFSYVNNENGDVYFTVNDQNLRDQIAGMLDQLTEYCETAESYHPTKGEICFAFCMGDWCRAHVLSANKEKDEYVVFFFDFGNIDQVKSEIIKCLPNESYGNISPLCTRFIAKDLKQLYNSKIPPSIGVMLEEKLVLGKEYEVNILQELENNTYLVDIPEMSTLLSNSESDDF